MHDHNKWLQIAKEDILVAKILLKEGFYSSAVYHCQQAAEKILKAYLVFNNETPLKTHDLTTLIELCMIKDKEFEKIYVFTKYLNPFSTKFRYPSEFDIPDHAHTKNIVQKTQKIIIFTYEKITILLRRKPTSTTLVVG